MKVVLTGSAAPLLWLLPQIPTGAAAGLFVDGDVALLAEEATRLRVTAEPFDALTTARLRQLAPEWLFAVALKHVLPEQMLSVPTRGCLNAHPGILPEYAGMDVHRWAILNGGKEFGAVVHWMEKEVDAGPIVSQQRFPIEPEDTGLSLYLTSCRVAVKLMSRAVDSILAGKTLAREPQDLSRRHVYRRIDDSRLDFTQPAAKVRDFVRAMLTPGGGAWTERDGRRIVVLKARLLGPGTGAPGTFFRRDGVMSVLCGDGQTLALVETSQAR